MVTSPNWMAPFHIARAMLILPRCSAAAGGTWTQPSQTGHDSALAQARRLQRSRGNGLLRDEEGVERDGPDSPAVDLDTDRVCAERRESSIEYDPAIARRPGSQKDVLGDDAIDPDLGVAVARVARRHDRDAAPV